MPNIFIYFLKFLSNSMWFRVFGNVSQYSLVALLFVFLSACSSQKNADTSKVVHNNSPLVTAIFSTNALVKQQIKQKKPLADILKYRSNTIVIYTSTQGVTLNNTLTEYATNTNVDITLVNYGKNDDELLKFLKQKPKAYQADIVLLSSAVSYEQAKDAQVLQPVLFESGSHHYSKHFSKFKKTWNNWLPLGFTSNVMVYNPNTVSAEKLQSINSLSQLLSSPDNKKICFPSLNTITAQQLFTQTYKQKGADHTSAVLNNTKNKVVALNNDHQILEHVQQKKCTIGLVSLVNYEQYLASKPSKKLAVVGLKGSANLIGAGITTQSYIPLKALKFLQWLSSVDGQLLFNADYKTLPTHTHLNSYQLKQPIQNLAQTVDLPQQKSVKPQHTNDNSTELPKTSLQELQGLYSEKLNRLQSAQDNMMATEESVQFDKDRQQEINLLQLKINAIKQINDRNTNFPINNYALVTSEEIKQVKTLIENKQPK